VLLGANENDEADLPRNVLPADGDEPQGRALVGDPRNDENRIVSQLNVLFLKFHNRVLEIVRAEQPTLGRDDLFEEAQRVVRSTMGQGGPCKPSLVPPDALRIKGARDVHLRRANELGLVNRRCAIIALDALPQSSPQSSEGPPRFQGRQLILRPFLAYMRAVVGDVCQAREPVRQP
jgi:hypothetical protein